MEIKNIHMNHINGCDILIYTENNFLVVLYGSDDGYIVLEHTVPILYSWSNYFSDSNKEIFEIHLKKLVKGKETNGTTNWVVKNVDKLLGESFKLTFYYTTELIERKYIEKVAKLKKNIYKVCENYLVDVFGDCLINFETFICGTLCGVVDCCVSSKYFILADKYNRIRLIDSDGSVKKFLFPKKEIKKLDCYGDKLFIFSNKCVDEYNLETEEFVKSMNYDSSRMILFQGKLVELSKEENHDVKFIIYEDKLVKIKF